MDIKEFFDKVIEKMNEGLVIIDNSGTIVYINPAANKILDIKKNIIGMKYGEYFFKNEKNDKFNQIVLNSVYEGANTKTPVVENNVVTKTQIASYYTEDEGKILSVTSSKIINKGEITGVTVTINDLTILSRYLSKDVVKQIMNTPEGLAMGGDKKDVTILMSDLRGFTSMCERVDSKKLISSLNFYLAKMTDIIEKYNGTIIEFLGDGIFVIFGAPISRQSHADDAVACALEMENAMAKVNEEIERHGFPKLEMGIGINSGETIVGNIGSIKKTKYGAMGRHVNLCGRIEAYTTGGQVLISQYTKDKLESDIECDDEFLVSPKGVKGEIKLYSLTSVKGKYNITFEKQKEEVKKLKQSKNIVFKLLENKMANDKELSGEIIAVSSEEIHIKTKENLKRFDNIKIEIDEIEEELFGKITNTEDDFYVMCITSRNEKVRQWLKTL